MALTEATAWHNIKQVRTTPLTVYTSYNTYIHTKEQKLIAIEVKIGMDANSTAEADVNLILRIAS